LGEVVIGIITSDITFVKPDYYPIVLYLAIYAYPIVLISLHFNQEFKNLFTTGSHAEEIVNCRGQLEKNAILNRRPRHDGGGVLNLFQDLGLFQDPIGSIDCPSCWTNQSSRRNSDFTISNNLESSEELLPPRHAEFISASQTNCLSTKV